MFYGGMKYADYKSSQAGHAGTRQYGERWQGRGGNNAVRRRKEGRIGGDFVRGEIISKDEESITIKLPNNGSKIIFLSSDTKITKTLDGISDDLKEGTQVSVSGKQNQEGSMTAQSIQIVPQLIPSP